LDDAAVGGDEAEDDDDIMRRRIDEYKYDKVFGTTSSSLLGLLSQMIYAEAAEAWESMKGPFTNLGQYLF